MSKTLSHSIKSDFLLEKGIELLWSKGYNATSVNDIVKAAKIPKGSFYFYFNSKEDFAVKALEKYFEEHFTPVLDILHDESVSAKQRVLNFYEFRSSMLKEELNCKMGCMASNLANEMAEHNEAIRNVIVSNGDFLKGHIALVVEKAQNNKEINSIINAHNLVEFIEDAGKGAMITMKEKQSAYPIDNYMDIIKTILLK
ncbi:MAG: TetR family transcriptional regulator [Flavobacteriaceae bacterium]|nr:TetR family transcriptional regulator [Flavobacteriaceae bacterium]